MAKITELGRIDRAVADNLTDIRENFEDYSGIVQDFIVFILQQVKFDLFGFTRFTLDDFCKASGRNRQDLALIHPMFVKGSKKPPEVNGFKFETIFDFGLYIMMKQNLVFKKAYKTKDGGQEITLEGIRIISDVRLNLNRKSKTIKIYTVKISPELLEGFIKRYYTIDSNAYKIIGKGKGGDNRKAFLIYLSRLRHILWSNGQESTIISVDVLCEQANIGAKEAKHKKLALSRTLKALKEKAGFPFKYDFVSAETNFEYFVRLDFPNVVVDFKNEHSFYSSLFRDLTSLFHKKYGHKAFDIKEPFQEWLTNNGLDFAEKAELLRKVYYRNFDKNLSDADIIEFMKIGFKNKKF